MGGSWSTWKELVQAQGEHANSPQKRPDPGIEPKTILLWEDSANRCTSVPPSFHSILAANKSYSNTVTLSLCSLLLPSSHFQPGCDWWTFITFLPDCHSKMILSSTSHSCFNPLQASQTRNVLPIPSYHPFIIHHSVQRHKSLIQLSSLYAQWLLVVVVQPDHKSTHTHTYWLCPFNICSGASKQATNPWDYDPRTQRKEGKSKEGATKTCGDIMQHLG